MDYDVIVLTETKCRSNNQVYFAGFRTASSENRLASGGVSISVRSHIEFEIIRATAAPPAGYDMASIKTKNLEKNLSIYAVYRHPREPITARDMNYISDLIEGEEDAVVMGDFNAHNALWNCDSTNHCGEILLDTMLE